MSIVHRFLAILALVGWPFWAAADEVVAPDPGIEATIEAQIEAFLADIHDHFKGRSAKRTELRRQLKAFIIAEVQSW